MTFKGIKAKVKFFAEKQEFITQGINQKPQQHITPTGCSIPEGLEIHDPAKGRIEKVNDGQDKIPGAVKLFTHETANVGILAG